MYLSSLCTPQFPFSLGRYSLSELSLYRCQAEGWLLFEYTSTMLIIEFSIVKLKGGYLSTIVRCRFLELDLVLPSGRVATYRICSTLQILEFRVAKLKGGYLSNTYCMLQILGIYIPTLFLIGSCTVSFAVAILSHMRLCGSTYR